MPHASSRGLCYMAFHFARRSLSLPALSWLSSGDRRWLSGRPGAEAARWAQPPPGPTGNGTRDRGQGAPIIENTKLLLLCKWCVVRDSYILRALGLVPIALGTRSEGSCGLGSCRLIRNTEWGFLRRRAQRVPPGPRAHDGGCEGRGGVLENGGLLAPWRLLFSREPTAHSGACYLRPTPGHASTRAQRAEGG